MVEIPYINYDTDEMILRDYLAVHRSQMANERTLLAYSRTALTMSGGGLTIFKLFQDFWVRAVGAAFIPSGIVIFILGLIRFFTVKHSFDDLEAEQGQKQEKTEDILVEGND